LGIPFPQEAAAEMAKVRVASELRLQKLHLSPPFASQAMSYGSEKEKLQQWP
jgi:hypothetical protein